MTAKQLPGAPTIDNPYALNVYHRAQVEDRAMGNNWPEGASVLAGARAVTKMGLVSEYRWAFDVEDCIDTIIGHGPCVLGIPWYDSMFVPDHRGLVTVAGTVAGGHCIIAYGFMPDDPALGGDVIWLRNSWGSAWGVNGTGYIRKTDLARLLGEDGECCVPTDRAVTPPVDAVDQQLANQVREWALASHYGSNRRAAQAVQVWMLAKGL